MKAIETVYKDYRFRSRLEARWAVCFDALGLRWRYEPEGFDLGEAGWYLPDFYIADWDSWIEVKGKMPSKEEMTKFFFFARGVNAEKETPRMQAMLCGTPGLPELHIGASPDTYSFGDGYAAITMSGQVLDEAPLTCFSALAMTGGGTDLDVWPMYFELSDGFVPLPFAEMPKNICPLGQGVQSDLVSFSPTHPPMRRHYIGSGVLYDASELKSAYKAARSARFEHGEKGAGA